MTAKDIYLRQLDLARAGDRPGQLEFYAPDAVVEFPFAPDGTPGRFHGRDEILTMLQALDRTRSSGTRVIEDRSSLTVHEGADPELVVAEVDLTVEFLDQAELQQIRQVHVVRIQDDKIISFRDYFAGDTTPLVRQALSPTGD
ncbi:nuclear transport factor 2 family protein [Microlunatus speluncae]|uniref:nuclear transport factor 2 family protein n=1 Tax=Microlunatus speluncae TaxID=2594267 RepID=UPI001266289B|nr:nuclear transport factor 2 family protein [Microlunatus speluncae]